MGFQLLRASIALGGDRGNTVQRHRHDPIAFPELILMQFMHGEDAVEDVAVVGDWPVGNDQMLQRLRTLYPAEIMDKVFPGSRPRLPQGDSTIPICTRPVYVAPPTLPDSPDPIVPHLGGFVSHANQPVIRGHDPDALAGQGTSADSDAPLPEDLAAHADDETDEDLFSPPNPQLEPSDVLHRNAKGSDPQGGRARRRDVAMHNTRNDP